MGFFEFFAGLLALLYAGVKSYGLAIILLTVVVRIVLLPLSIKQTQSMRAMQRLQPEIKKLQAKYKGDKKKLNEEMMKLYKGHEVNPFGGCLPMVLQLPVFLALYRVIRTPLQYMGYTLASGTTTHWVTQHVSGLMRQIQQSELADRLFHQPAADNNFLTLRMDCSPTEVLHQGPSVTVHVPCGSSPISVAPYLILVLLMGLTTFYQQRQLQGTRAPSDPQAQQMQMFNRIMPLMLMFFSFTFPTGLTVYWLTTNLWTILQQRWVLSGGPAQVADKAPAEAPSKKAPAKPPTAKPSKGSPAKRPAGDRADARGARAGARSSGKKKRK
jgi:YidC/Oxa1 family membrane protein insertase